MSYSSNNSKYVANCIKRRKKNLKKVFHSQCCLCGFDSFSEALEFHHVNPEEKSFSISGSNAATKSLEKQLEEMHKCILVCANCHRGIHYGYLKVPNNYKEFYDEDVANELREELKRIVSHRDHYCQRCGKVISGKGKLSLCPDCAHLVQRTVDRPDREELKRLIRITPFTQLGAQYGVTDNTIRKWCDFYNLPRKVKEIKLFSDEEWEKI